MNKRILFRTAVYSFVFVSASGSLLHFVYDWSGQNRLAGYFSAVNESTWEHMKLMFFPVFIFALYLLFRYRKSGPSVFPAYAISALLSIFLIPVLYYTYTGVLGRNIDLLNILIFYISAACGSTVFYCTACKYDLSRYTFPLIIIHIILLIIFILFTYTAPELAIFDSPVWNCTMKK